MELPFCLENVYYINLENRIDRKKSIETQLDNLGWNYQRFNAIRHKKGFIGCTLSHIKVIESAKSLNLPYVVVLEDDIVFSNVLKFQELYQQFLDQKIDFDVYLLGGNLFSKNKKLNKNLIRVNNSASTVGYIVREHYYDKLLNNFKLSIKLNKPLDIYWTRLQKTGKWYISYPRTITQIPGYSDIEKKTINYDRLMLDFKACI